MAIIGVPVITQISDRKVRVTGFQIPTDDEAVVGLAQAVGAPTPDILLPAGFVVSVYAYGGSPIPLAKSIEVNLGLDLTPGAFTNLFPSVTPSGTTLSDFRITITNTNTTEPTQPLDVVFEFNVPLAAQPSVVG